MPKIRIGNKIAKFPYTRAGKLAAKKARLKVMAEGINFKNKSIKKLVKKPHYVMS